MYFFICTTTGGNGHRYNDDDSKIDHRKKSFKIRTQLCNLRYKIVNHHSLLRKMGCGITER